MVSSDLNSQFNAATGGTLTSYGQISNSGSANVSTTGTYVITFSSAHPLGSTFGVSAIKLYRWFS